MGPGCRYGQQTRKASARGTESTYGVVRVTRNKVSDDTGETCVRLSMVPIRISADQNGSWAARPGEPPRRRRPPAGGRAQHDQSAVAV